MPIWPRGGTWAPRWWSTRTRAPTGRRAVRSHDAPDLEDLLGGCDVVDVCTPTDTHHGIVMQAAAVGRNIICEKPLSHRRSEALEMIEACEAAGVQLHPGQVVRYFPEYAAAKLVAAGGSATRRPAAEPSGCATGAPWFADATQSGGLLVDQMIHDFDFARWVAGEVVQVFASRWARHPVPPSPSRC